MKHTTVLAVLALSIVCIPARADDVASCMKVSGDSAVEACTRVIDSGRWQGEGLSWAYGNRGTARRAMGDLDGAIADYSRAIELDPREPKGYYNRGSAKQEKNDLDGAIADFSRAIELNPQYVFAYNNRGTARLDKGDPDGAIADHSRAIEINPRHAASYNNRGYARLDKGDHNAAIADFNRAIELNPRYSFAYNNRGIAKRDKGDLNGAIADLNRAIEQNPRYALAYTNRGLARYFKGEFALAISDLSRSLRLKNDTYPALWLFLARTRASANGQDELRAHMATLNFSTWPTPVVALYLGNIRPGGVLKIAEHADPMISKEQLCEANFFVGKWYLLIKGERSKALTHLRTARDQCPKTLMGHAGAVHALRRLGER